MSPVPPQHATNLDPPPDSQHHTPITSGPIYNDTLEKFLEFLIAAYCIWALFYLIYITVRFAVWTAKKTGEALIVAFEGAIASELQSLGEKVVEIFVEATKNKTENGGMCMQKEDFWAALDITAKVITLNERGAKTYPFRRSNTV